MSDSIDLEAMRALALKYRGVAERIANVKVPPPPSDLSEDPRVAYRQGVEAALFAVRQAKREG